jgi:hypothetical protein
MIFLLSISRSLVCMPAILSFSLSSHRFVINHLSSSCVSVCLSVCVCVRAYYHLITVQIPVEFVSRLFYSCPDRRSPIIAAIMEFDTHAHTLSLSSSFLFCVLYSTPWPLHHILSALLLELYYYFLSLCWLFICAHTHIFLSACVLLFLVVCLLRTYSSPFSFCMSWPCVFARAREFVWFLFGFLFLYFMFLASPTHPSIHSFFCRDDKKQKRKINSSGSLVQRSLLCRCDTVCFSICVIVTHRLAKVEYLHLDRFTNARIGQVSL